MNRSGDVRVTSQEPLYRQVGTALRRRIECGELRAGERLPAEVELAREFGVSRQTMRAALAELVREGHLDRRRGAGTIVIRPNLVQRPVQFYTIDQDMRASGASLVTRVLSRGVYAATDRDDARARRHLSITGDDAIGFLSWLRLLDGAPLLLEHITFPAALCPELLQSPGLGERDRGEDTFYDVLAALRGIRATHMHEVIRPVLVSEDEAHLLETCAGAPALRIERTSYAGDIVIEWRETLARGDRFSFALDLPNPDEIDHLDTWSRITHGPPTGCGS